MAVVEAAGPVAIAATMRCNYESRARNHNHNLNLNLNHTRAHARTRTLTLTLALDLNLTLAPYSCSHRFERRTIGNKCECK